MTFSKVFLTVLGLGHSTVTTTYAFQGPAPDKLYRDAMQDVADTLNKNKKKPSSALLQIQDDDSFPTEIFSPPPAQNRVGQMGGMKRMTIQQIDDDVNMSKPVWISSKLLRDEKSSSLLLQDKHNKNNNQHIVRPLYKSIPNQNAKNIPPYRNAIARKRFGIDEKPTEYWFNNKIHTFGNTGFFGAVHAAMAPFATWLIDTRAYEGVDIRTEICKDVLRGEKVNKSKARVLDLCCGVGMSTRALQTAFPDADAIIGVDTSPEMISMARAVSKQDVIRDVLYEVRDTLSSGAGSLMNRVRKVTTKDLWKSVLKANAECQKTIRYARGNAERVKLPVSTFDLVTIMYAFHEVPKTARYRILRESRRLLKHGGTLAIIDICPTYEPSAPMLAGEPYVLEYKKNIMNQLRSTQGFGGFEYRPIIAGKVGLWLLTRDEGKKSMKRSGRLVEEKYMTS